MSCHSTPGNLAVLGYCAGAYQLDSRSVEGEFHWLKKLGKERRVATPSESQWQSFLDQQAQWVAHDQSVPRVRRARLAERVAAARDVLPDGPSFFALQNLPARLAYVTDAGTVRSTVLKVQTRVDEFLGGKDVSEVPVERFAAVEAELRNAFSLLDGTGADHPVREEGSAEDVLTRISDVVEMIDTWVSTPLNREGEAVRENMYQAHRRITAALRMLRSR